AECLDNVGKPVLHTTEDQQPEHKQKYANRKRNSHYLPRSGRTQQRMAEANDYTRHRIQAQEKLPALRDVMRRINHWRDEQPHLHDEWHDVFHIAEADVQG